MSTPAQQMAANIAAQNQGQPVGMVAGQPAGQPAGIPAGTPATPGQVSPQLQSLEQKVAAAIAGEPEPTQSATGGQILPEYQNEGDHDRAIFNKGQELAAQLERQRLSYESQLAQSNQQMGAIQNQLAQVTNQLAQVQSNTPTHRELSPAEKYALSPEQLTELEPTLEGIQKVANAAAETESQKTIAALKAEIEARDQKFNSVIDELKAQQTLQGQITQSTYDTTIYNTGLSLGIDVSQLPKDQNFQNFLNQQESPFSERNLHAVVQDAEKRGDVKTTAKILKAYADAMAAANGNTGAPTGLSGIPSGGGALGSTVPPHMQNQIQEEDPLVRLNNQRAELQAMRQTLNTQMSTRSIDPDSFRTEMYKIDQLDNQLIDKMRSGT